VILECLWEESCKAYPLSPGAIKLALLEEYGRIEAFFPNKDQTDFVSLTALAKKLTLAKCQRDYLGMNAGECMPTSVLCVVFCTYVPM
jgi:hypothetical protein